MVHQTGSRTAASAFNSYKVGKNGAHFLIDKDGTVYQTARIDRVCWHVGMILGEVLRPQVVRQRRAQADQVDPLQEGRLVRDTGQEGQRPRGRERLPRPLPHERRLARHRVVGAIVDDTTDYEPVTDAQNASLGWLLSVLENLLSLTSGDVYRHPEVAYKQASEAATASWK